MAYYYYIYILYTYEKAAAARANLQPIKAWKNEIRKRNSISIKSKYSCQRQTKTSTKIAN